MVLPLQDYMQIKRINAEREKVSICYDFKFMLFVSFS